MPISATGNSTPQNGFTLVELLVVLAIMGVAAAAVLFAMPGGSDARVEAQRFAAAAETARDAAIIASAPMAVRIDAAGYRFERYERGAWTAVARKPLVPVAWPEGLVARTEPANERVRFDPTGLADPVTLLLSAEGRTTRVVIDAGGEVHVAD